MTETGCLGQAWWRTSVIPALWKMQKDYHEFQASLDIVNPVLKSGHKQNRGSKCFGKQSQLFAGVRDWGEGHLSCAKGNGWCILPGRQLPSVRQTNAYIVNNVGWFPAKPMPILSNTQKIIQKIEVNRRWTTTRSQDLSYYSILQDLWSAMALQSHWLCPIHGDRDFG